MEEIINDEKYILVKTIDNSAPCGKCAFHSTDYNNICSHPDKANRKCEHKRGTNKGWNTLEYKKI